jgi:hypothetical protein
MEKTFMSTSRWRNEVPAARGAAGDEAATTVISTGGNLVPPATGGDAAAARADVSSRAEVSSQAAPGNAPAVAAQHGGAKKHPAATAAPAGAAGEADAKPAEPSAPTEEPGRPTLARQTLDACIAGGCSALVHLTLVLVLGLWVLPEPRRSELKPLTAQLEDRAQEFLNRVLEEELDPTRQLALTSSSIAGASAGDARGPAGQIVGVSSPRYEKSVAQAAEDGLPIDVGDLTTLASRGAELAGHLPDGMLGEPSAIVDDYQQAMDRITEEILNQLARGKVLVIWCFDQSLSMKDDQQELRARFGRVYAELGLAQSAQGEALWTAICSFGQGWAPHTEKPTSNVSRLEAAIDQIPVDESGIEMMCQAVRMSLNYYRKNSRGRQLMLILVTDESGDPEKDLPQLEDAIAEAKAARCRVYVLGREAVFGYPYAHMSYTDPETGIGGFWLPIDRGPETAYCEQLQVDGFTRRYDAFPSGFGPYSQTRLAWETGGIFFMLPSPETNLVRGENRKYELEAMRPYLPDLISRSEYLARRQASPLQLHLWKIICDLNPYDPQHAPYVELPTTFPIEPQAFAQAAERAKAVAAQLVMYLERAEQSMKDIADLRRRETSPRWQANYDLMLAQLIAFRVRIFEYGAYLQAFQRTPKPITNPLGPTRKTNYWGLGWRTELLTAEKHQAAMDEATKLFQQIISDHPGTPWAARAQWELNRGFGVELNEGYSDPRSSSVKLPRL